GGRHLPAGTSSACGIGQEVRPRLRATGDEHDVAAAQRNAGATGRERRLAAGAFRAVPTQRPVFASVMGFEDLKTAVHGIAEDHSMRSLESHAVKERIGIAILESQLPAPTPIAGAVHPRRLAGTNAQRHRVLRVDAFDVTKVEVGRAGHLDDLPMLATIDGPQHRALATAGPGDLVADRGQSTQTHVDAAVLRNQTDPRRLPGLCPDGCGKRQQYRPGDNAKRDRHRYARPAIDWAPRLARRLQSVLAAPPMFDCLRTISIATSSACS